MTVREQAVVNFVDSKATSIFGLAIIGLKALCDTGLVNMVLSEQLAGLLCSMVSSPATYAAAAGLLVSRGPATPPR